MEGNSGPRPTFTGWKDLQLTPLGLRQAAAVGGRLARENLGAIYSSDLQRALVTAQNIARPHGLEVQTSPALREVNYGAWAGLGEAEIKAGWAEEWAARKNDLLRSAPPDGESVAQMWHRLEPVWNEISERHAQSGQDAVLVAHNGPVRVLMCRVLGVPLENYRRVRVANCSISVVEIKSGAPPLVSCVNDTSHLIGL